MILKRIDREGRTSRGGFVWPGVGGTARPESWDPSTDCGGGLHGWPWGMGLGEGAAFDVIADEFLVLAAAPSDVVGELQGGWKCKAREVEIVYSGPFGGAWSMIEQGRHRLIDAMSRATLGGDASSGYGSTAASSGDGSTAASSGDRSTAASSGYGSTAASSGDRSTAASSGYRSKAASSGDGSTAASSGYGSKAEAKGGDTLACVAGLGGQVRVGERGAFALPFWTEADGWRFVTGKVGESGIKADTWYTVRDGALVEVGA